MVNKGKKKQSHHLAAFPKEDTKLENKDEDGQLNHSTIVKELTNDLSLNSIVFDPYKSRMQLSIGNTSKETLERLMLTRPALGIDKTSVT
jgi:hypothetical protein